MSVRQRVRPNDPQTSWDAASAQDATKRAGVQRAIMHVLRFYGPQTHSQLIGHLPLTMSPSGIRTRTSELQTLGWVTPLLDAEGEVTKRRGDGGMPSIVWRACADGERTGIDPRDVAAEIHDPAIDRTDLAAMRAAIEDALRIYDQALIDTEEAHGDEAYLMNAADAMAQRLRELRHQPIVVPDPTMSDPDASFPRNDRADRLW